jgi:membrane protease YdiL (CAAX protease family)
MSEEARTPPPPVEPDAAAAPAEAHPPINQDVPLEHPEESEVELPTWEDDENTVTLGLRSATALVIGGLLAYAQWNSPLVPALAWGQWVWTSVICNFLLPAGVIWFFFAQHLTLQDWLKDQKHNAWTYGWDFKQWKRHLLMGGALWLVLLPFLIYAARDPAVRMAAMKYVPVRSTPADWAFVLSTLVLYMFCWEWFFRGFLLFGLAQGFTWIPAVLLQALIFGLSHSGKAPVEFYSSFAGGLVLGTLCWREKSFLPAFVAHALIHVTWFILM